MVAFLDPMPWLIDTKEQNQMFGNIPNKRLLVGEIAQGVGPGMDTSKVVADMNFKMPIGGRNGQPQEAPAVLRLTPEGINRDDIVTSQIDDIWLPYAGRFHGHADCGAKGDSAAQKHYESQLVGRLHGQSFGSKCDEGVQNLPEPPTRWPCGSRVSSRLLFLTENPKRRNQTRKRRVKRRMTNRWEKKPEDSLKESKQDTTVILVADADMLSDNVAVRQIPTPFGNFSQVMNGNLNFAQNAVEQLTGDNNLIGVRSRATQNRPFTKIRQMENEANKKFQNEIKKLEESRAESATQNQRTSATEEGQGSTLHFVPGTNC